MKIVSVLFCVFMLSTRTIVAHAGQNDLDELLQRSLTAYGRVQDYRCTFHKKELVQGEIVETRNIQFKFRKPASFYLKNTEGSEAGLEAIYVDGKYNNKLEVHLGGVLRLIPIAIDPRGSQALKKNRHPIMDAGVGQILALIEKNYRQAKNDPESRITLEGDTMVNGRSVRQVMALFPKGRGYYGGKIVIGIDKETLLPVKITVYGWNNEFLEEYQYDGIKLNVGLNDQDFDINNPAYRF